MNISIATRGFELTPAIGGCVHDTLGAVLARFEGSIHWTEVRLDEARGPAGGAGVSAAMTVFLDERTPVRITTVHADLFTAISITAKRVEQAVERSIGQRSVGLDSKLVAPDALTH